MRAPSAKQVRQAARLLWRGKVRMHVCGPFGCFAEVDGRSGTYEVELDGDGWRCSCAYQEYHPGSCCSHIAAALMVFRALQQGDAEGKKPEPSSAPGV